MKEEIKKVLDDILKIPSVSSDISSLHRIVDYVEKYFLWMKNIYITKYQWNDIPSILIQNFEWKDADIMFNGHLDVVPPSETNQFFPFSDNGKTFARWAGDMKSGIALMMCLWKTIFHQENFHKKIAFLFTSDEEVWGENGVKKILETENLIPKIVIIPDSGSVENIVIAEKWIIKLEIQTQWKSCHASRSWLWKNALEQVYIIYQELRELFEEKQYLHPPTYWWSTVNLTVVTWWEVSNMIPSIAKAVFDIRFTETFQNIEDTQKIIQNILDKHQAKMLKIMSGDLLFTQPENIYVKKYIKSVKKVLWYTPNLVKEHGASDGRFFAAENIPVLLHRPTCAWLHAKNEYVENQAIEKIYDCYQEFVFSL